MTLITMPTERRKTHSVRVLGTVDIGALLAAVSVIPEETWQAENANKPNRFEALDSTQHIVFRFVDSLQDWRFSHDRAPWSSWRGVLEPVLQQATAAYGYQRGMYPRMMLARMRPHSSIKPHIDASPSAQWPHKIHVPIATSPEVRFFIESESYHLAVGCAYEVNNLVMHSVVNSSDQYRTHLIFEYCETPSDC